MNMGTMQQELKSALLTIYQQDEAVVICDWVLDYYTGTTRMQRATDKPALPDINIIKNINEAKEQLLLHKPVQYVLGEAWFMGYRFFVDENVLIPRPETEELVAFVVENIASTTNISVAELNILDIGTGSGCIPVLLKKQFPQAKICSIDVCNAALQVAVKNAAALQASIHFIHLNFLEEANWQSMPVFDIIVSNPPYIPLTEKAALDKNVTAWEPGTALFVPDNDALLFYKKIAHFGKNHLAPGGKIFVETHQDYALTTKKMFEEKGYTALPKKDINGNDRMLMVWIEN